MAEIIAGMLSGERYKRSQGRIARQATFYALAAAAAIGAWILSARGDNASTRFIVPLAVAAAGIWAAFRVVNIPAFAEFLISVQNEMNKVSWPSREELWRASMVVVVVIFLLVGILFAYDVALKALVTFLLGS